MSLVVFLRGVNVVGHRKFRPSILAKGLSNYGVVNVGAAGTSSFAAWLKDEVPCRIAAEAAVRSGSCDLRRSRSHPPRDGESISSRAITARYRSICEHPVESRRPPRSPVIPARGGLVRVMASKEQFVFGVYRRHMTTIGYLGRIDTLLGCAGNHTQLEHDPCRRADSERPGEKGHELVLSADDSTALAHNPLQPTTTDNRNGH